MIADIFYPTLTPTITVLACFIRKKKQSFSRVSHPCLPKASPWTPRGAYSSRQIPSSNCFWLCQKPMRPYFFSVLSTKGLMTFSKIRFRKFLRNLIETYNSGSVLHRVATFPVGNYIFKVKDRSAEYVQG